VKLVKRPGEVVRLGFLLLLFAGAALVAACRDKAPTEAAYLVAGLNKNMLWGFLPMRSADVWNLAGLPRSTPGCASEARDSVPKLGRPR